MPLWQNVWNKPCKMRLGPGMATHTFDPSILEAEAGAPLWVWGQPGLYSEFQVSQGYVERLCLKIAIH